MATRYVDVNSDGGDGTTSALTGTNAAYNSLSYAESQLPATLTEPYTIVCGSADAAHTANTTAATFSGVTTSATNYVLIQADANSKATMPWSTSKYRLSVANAHALTLSLRYIRVDGLQLEKSSSSANVQSVISVATVATGGSDIRISNCVLRQAGNASYSEPGIYLNDADATVSAWNIVSYGQSTSTSAANAAIYVGVGTLYLYSSTLIGGQHGLRIQTGTTATVKNTYAYGASSAYSSAGTLTLTNSAASDTTGDPGTLDSIAYNTTQFTNVTGGSQDFHLPSGSGLIDVGTDTSGESEPFNFTTDLDGNTRSTWDVGAFEYSAGGPTTTAIAFALAGAGDLSASQIREALLALGLTNASSTLSIQQTAIRSIALALSNSAQDFTIVFPGGVIVTRIALALGNVLNDFAIVVKRVVPQRVTMESLGTLNTSIKSILKQTFNMAATSTLALRLAGQTILRRARLAIRQGLGF